MPANPTVEEILAQTRLLSLEERVILLEKLRADLLQPIEGLPSHAVKKEIESL